MKTFYGIGSILFSGVFVMNVWNFLITYQVMNLPNKISYLAGNIFFNLLLATLFIGLWKVTPQEIVNNKELDNMLIKYSEGGKDGITKQKKRKD
jgi:hypothetical protein